MNVWLTNTPLQECWGPFKTVPDAWRFYLGWDPRDPERAHEWLEIIPGIADAGWTVNEIQHFPVRSKATPDPAP